MAQIGKDEADLPSSTDIAEAMYRADITAFPGWRRTAEYTRSSEAKVRNLDVLKDIVVWHDDKFECGFNIDLEFKFDRGPEPRSFSRDYPGIFRGHVENGRPVVDDIRINMKSFYR